MRLRDGTWVVTLLMLLVGVSSLMGSFAPAMAKTIVRNGFTIEVVDERIVPLWGGNQRYYWLDDEKLVFLGAYVDDFRGKRWNWKSGPSMRGVFVWEPNKPV